MSHSRPKEMKKSGRGQLKNILATNSWPMLTSAPSKKSETSSAPSKKSETSSAPSKKSETSSLPGKKSPTSQTIAAGRRSSDRDNVNSADIRKLLDRVAELETSYANLMEMYNTQIKINGAIMDNISTMASYCLESAERKMNMYSSMCPRMMQPYDRQRVFRTYLPVNIMQYDDGAIVSSMLECQMYKPLLEVIFNHMPISKFIQYRSRFVPNVKLVIAGTPWESLVNKFGIHILDALRNRANTYSIDQYAWRELYEYADLNKPTGVGEIEYSE